MLRIRVQAHGNRLVQGLAQNEHFINGFLSLRLPLPPPLPCYCGCRCCHYFRAFRLRLTPSTIPSFGKLVNFMTSHCLSAPHPLPILSSSVPRNLSVLSFPQWWIFPKSLYLAFFSSDSLFFPWANSYILILSLAIYMLINPMFSVQVRLPWAMHPVFLYCRAWHIGDAQNLADLIKASASFFIL